MTPHLELLVKENAAFNFVLAVARFAAVPQDDTSLGRSKRRADHPPLFTSVLLRVHEDSVLWLIADFAGVVRGGSCGTLVRPSVPFYRGQRGRVDEEEQGDYLYRKSQSSRARARSPRISPGRSLLRHLHLAQLRGRFSD